MCGVVQAFFEYKWEISNKRTPKLSPVQEMTSSVLYAKLWETPEINPSDVSLIPPLPTFISNYFKTEQLTQEKLSTKKEAYPYSGQAPRYLKTLYQYNVVSICGLYDCFIVSTPPSINPCFT